MGKISNWLHQFSNGITTLAALVLFVGFTATVLPQQAARANEYSGEAGSVDQRFFYSADEVYQIAEVYGEAGRGAYVRARMTFDVIWPLVYTFFLGTAISYIYYRVLLKKSPWLQVNLIPVGGMLFDFLENFSISIVMAVYPTRLTFLAGLTAVFTLVKWLLVYGSFGALLVGLVLWARMLIIRLARAERT